MNRHDQLQKQINRLELDINREKTTINKNERKKRTRRLIQKGALLEKYFDVDHLNVEETEELLMVFSDYVKGNTPKKYLK